MKNEISGLSIKEIIREYNKKYDLCYNEALHWFQFAVALLLLFIISNYYNPNALESLFILLSIWFFLFISGVWFSDNIILNPYTKAVYRMVNCHKNQLASEYKDSDHIELVFFGLPHGNFCIITIFITSRYITITDGPPINIFLKETKTLRIEDDYKIIKNKLTEKDVTEIQNILKLIPEKGKKQIGSEVMDGLPCKLKIIRKSDCYNYKCNYAGIPDKNINDEPIRLIKKIFDISEGFKMKVSRGASTDRFGNITIYR